MLFSFLPHFCYGIGIPSTVSPEIVKGKEKRNVSDGTAWLFDPYSRENMIAVAKREILHRLGMTKRPPRMHNLRASVPKPVSDGEISSLFSAEEEPMKTTQVVISAEEGTFQRTRLSFTYSDDI